MNWRKWFLCSALVVVFLVAVTNVHRLAPIPFARLVIPQSGTGIRLAPGESLQMDVEGYRKDGQPVGEEELQDLDPVWEYSNADVCFVDEDGEVTAVAPGVANVNVRTGDGETWAGAVTIHVE